MGGSHVSPNYPSRGQPMTPSGSLGPYATGSTGATGPIYTGPTGATGAAGPPYSYPEPEAEPVAEPVIGYRLWNVLLPQDRQLTTADLAAMEARWQKGLNPFSIMLAPTLGGVGVHKVWTQGADAHQAMCSQGRTHRAPHFYCDCGFWAFKHPQRMMAKLAHAALTPIAYGEVQLWGKIVETTDGYRAEYARPYMICTYGLGDDDAAKLGEAYGCEVVAGPFPEEASRIFHLRAERQAKRETRIGKVLGVHYLSPAATLIGYDPAETTPKFSWPGPKRNRALLIFALMVLLVGAFGVALNSYVFATQMTPMSAVAIFACFAGMLVASAHMHSAVRLRHG